MSSNDLKKKSQAVARFNPVRVAGSLGVRSNHLYLAGLISVVVSFVTWLASRGKKDSRPQSDRWGLFIGEWAPTFFGMGLALNLEEDRG